MIVERNLFEVWDAPDGGAAAILAVRDFGVPVGELHPGLPPAYRALELNASLPYFNCGLLRVDLRLWRELDVGRQALDYCARFKDCVHWADQDGLNLALAGRIGELDPRWNVQIGAVRTFDDWPASSFKEAMRFERTRLFSSPGVLHFTGVRKPWNAGLTNPLRRRFDHYLRKSGWYPGLSYASYRATWLATNVRDIAGILLQRARRVTTAPERAG
jgi:lipopolysaccharide biosynthesis glycosyltransferase